MTSITLTAKRQATLPRELCDEMGLRPGDRVDVERMLVHGIVVWALKPQRQDWSWIGSVPTAPTTSHDLDDIRVSIGRGSAEDRT